jgi:hypothetical protein
MLSVTNKTDQSIILSIGILSVVMLSVIMLIVVMLSFIKLTVSVLGHQTVY